MNNDITIIDLDRYNSFSEAQRTLINRLLDEFNDLMHNSQGFSAQQHVKNVNSSYAFQTLIYYGIFVDLNDKMRKDKLENLLQD